MLFEKLLIIGAGGHSKVVVDAIQLCEKKFDIEIWDDDPTLNRQSINGISIQSPISNINQFDCLIHIAIGNNQVRKRIYQLLSDKTKQLFTIEHPKVTISPSAILGKGCFVAAHAVIAPGSEINYGVVVNHLAVVDHDCKIGPWSHIAPHATLGGGVQIGEGCLVGAGAVVLPGINVGDWVTIGAGAVVTKDIASHQTVIGIPAKRI